MSDTGTDATTAVTSPTVNWPAKTPSRLPLFNSFFTWSRSRSTAFAWSSTCCTLVTTSCGFAFTRDATDFNVCSSCCAKARAALPVTASIRRTPEPIPPSEVIRNWPINPVFSTWEPPHNSMENSGTDTTRTSEPYFSPNNAIAPFAFAASMDTVSTSNVEARRICSFTIFVIVCNSSAVTGEKCVKSKRK